MPDPQWTVSIIAQYTEKDEFVRKCFDLLIQSIQKHRNPNVKFCLLKYHRETEVTKFITFDLVSGAGDRVPHSSSPKSTKNFYDGPEVITEFFRDFSIKTNAAHHFLVTWGHGAGFGMFAEGSVPERLLRFISQNTGNQLLDKDLTRKMLEPVLFYNRMVSSGAVVTPPVDELAGGFVAFLRASGIFSLDEQEMFRELNNIFRIVTMQNFAKAIRESFGQTKIDFMYAMNCYMQMIETGYLLKDNVRYFGSAENFQLFPGPDYDALFEDLGTRYAGPDPDLDMLAKSIIGNHKKKYEREDVRQLLLTNTDSMNRVIRDIDESFLSITRPAVYEILREQIDRLARLFLANRSRALYLKIQKARKKCRDVTSDDFGIIDILHLCRQLSIQQLPVAGLSDCLSSIITMIGTPGQLVVDKKEAPGLCRPPNLFPSPTSCPNGLSIFFPKDKNSSLEAQYARRFMDQIYRQPNGSPQDIFLTDSLWDEFVIDYFDSGLPDD